MVVELELWKRCRGARGRGRERERPSKGGSKKAGPRRVREKGHKVMIIKIKVKRGNMHANARTQ